jgi:hypothetical protein
MVTYRLMINGQQEGINLYQYSEVFSFIRHLRIKQVLRYIGGM